MAIERPAKKTQREKPTCGIGQLILLPLDPILESLGLATRLLDARLHRLGRHIVGLRIHGGGFEREQAKKGSRAAGEGDSLCNGLLADSLVGGELN